MNNILYIMENSHVLVTAIYIALLALFAARIQISLALLAGSSFTSRSLRNNGLVADVIRATRTALLFGILGTMLGIGLLAGPTLGKGAGHLSAVASGLPIVIETTAIAILLTIISHFLDCVDRQNLERGLTNQCREPEASDENS